MSNIAYFLSISVTLFAYHYCFGEAGEVSSLGLNSVMKPTQSTTLVSPNRTFAAGFISIGNQAYAFGIWYATIPDRTVTWLANRDHAVDQNSSLILTKNGDMVITRSNGTVIWATNTSDSQVKQALLLENANVQKQNPSRKNEHTYSSGVYTLSFNKDNRLSLFYGGLGVAVPERYWVDLDSLNQTEYVMTGGGEYVYVSVSVSRIRVSGRRDFEFLTAAAMEGETWCFPVWAFEMTKRGEMREIVDQNMGVEGKHEWNEVERMMKTAFWCIQTDAILRPSMGEVVPKLEGTLPVEEPVDLNFSSFI
eukprot:Gb_37087 [translate_table: standard]